jgi:cytochrome b
MRPGASAGEVAAWDLPVRLFHWTLVAFIASAWVSYEFAEDIGDSGLVWHRWNGLAILTLTVWRVLWGFAGSPTARFRSFVRSPMAAAGYARDLMGGRARQFLGHNPLGAWMVLALLAALVAQAALGLFAIDDSDLTGGPLQHLVPEDVSKLATRWHGRVFHYVLLPLIAVHATANALHQTVRREPLITAMITGRKPAAAYADGEGPGVPQRGNLRAFVCLLASAAIVACGVAAAGGRMV